MTDAERSNALLDLVDPDRSANPQRGPELVVLGLAARTPRGGYLPTRAGWTLMSDKGRAFQSR